MFHGNILFPEFSVNNKGKLDFVAFSYYVFKYYKSCHAKLIYLKFWVRINFQAYKSLVYL